MDNKSDVQLIVMQATIEANSKESDEKIMKLIEDLKLSFKSTITSMMDQANIPKSSPAQKDSPKPPEISTVVLDNRRVTELDGGHYKKIVGMWTITHETSSTNFYEILAIDLKNFYNRINMSLNAVTRL